MDIFQRRQIRQFANDNWETLKQYSFANYLVRGFNSIILLMTDDLVIRLYITEPGRHVLYGGREKDNNVLLIHNHSFDFQCQTLIGRMENLLFEEMKDGNFGTWKKYNYFSALESSDGVARVSLLDHVDLGLSQITTVHAGSSYYMHHTQLHRIVVPSHELTAMLFWEHKKIVDPTKLLYSKRPIGDGVLNMDDMYKRMHESELRRLINLVLDHVEER